MDKVNEEYKCLLMNIGNRDKEYNWRYNVCYGFMICSPTRGGRPFFFNFRKWVKSKNVDDYHHIANLTRIRVGTTVIKLPPHYFHTQLIPELPYKGTDIVFWFWTLQQWLPIKELQLKIIYWVMIIEDGESGAGIQKSL